MMIDVKSSTAAIIDEIEKGVIGKREVLEELMAAVLSGGHILFEDFPGLAKTLIANSLASSLGLTFRRVQFTPDLLPGDITGGYIFNRMESRFDLKKGPVFTNILLADEINRASPKTQSALLEAMQEKQVTIEGDTYPLPDPFIVIATQNPVEYEGTFPLPEAQLDRFMVRLSVGYPTVAEEREILSRRRIRKTDEVAIEAVTDSAALKEMRDVVESVHLDGDLEEYIVKLIAGTRHDQRIRVGSSPRGSLALMKLAMSHAAIAGRDYVLPDDIKKYLIPALSHRIMLEPDYWMRKHAAEDILTAIGKNIPVPVLEKR
ncbi:AAA family ATPase [Spirochaeta isovalerica]|uniref:MoxR-like ATPase n=1 Tax=Spirochaeta isovalerica TaxID=150 RepID=A0A841R8J3_9SPIO|nr:MoxR family ATPase [Spirochaeta isovalerica]MBB6480126.1 MoxR-like ATPase [Spirochaeta isovalerica]